MRRDLDRIGQGHVITWDYDPVQGVRYWCSCPKKGPRNRDKLDIHLIHAIEKERGPTRPPNNKT
jgi:hypothetical protein